MTRRVYRVSTAPHLPGLQEQGTGTPSVRMLPGARGLDQAGADTRRLLLILMGVVGTVLLIACVNLAGLMLARGAARQRELATRRALGATRMRLVRQMSIEGICLAVAGGAGGLFLTWVSRHVLTSVLTAGLGTLPLSTQPLEVVVDARLLAWTVGLSLGAALACSLLPALRMTGVDPVAQLKHHVAGGATTKLNVGRGLIALQIAASVPLLVGAALFLQTLSNLGRVDLGFDPEGIAFFKIDPVATGAAEDQHASIYQALLNRLQQVPGVVSVTLIENVFLSGITSNTRATVDGRQTNLYTNAVGPGFLETMGMRLMAGRAPGLQDGPGSPRVAAINLTAARQAFGTESPLGRTIQLGGGTRVEVVGVVGDSLYDRPRANVRPVMFDSALQRPGDGGHHVVLRVSGKPHGLDTAIREAVAEVRRDLPVPEITTQVAQMDRAIVRERVFAQTLTAVGGFALLLVGIGLHGVTSYTVARRRSEIGVRVALGARPGQVLWLILRQVVVLSLIGLAAGIPLAAALAPLAGSLLFGVAATDGSMIVAAAAVMLLVAIAAAAIPARQAVRLDPLVTLRAE